VTGSSGARCPGCVMTRRRPCPAAPGPLERYAARFDDLFGSLAPRDRNKTLTALAGAEPALGGQHPAVQRLQFSRSESRWDPDRVNARRLELLLADPATAPHGGGVLVIDDSGVVAAARRPRTWVISGWAGTARPITGPSRWCGLTSVCTIRCMPCRTPRPGASRKGRAIRRSAPAWRSARISRSGPGRRDSCSARWPPTAPTGIRTGSAASWRRPGCRS